MIVVMEIPKQPGLGWSDGVEQSTGVQSVPGPAYQWSCAIPASTPVVLVQYTCTDTSTPAHLYLQRLCGPCKAGSAAL